MIEALECSIFPTTRPADFDCRCLQKHMTSQSNFRLDDIL